MNIWDQITAEAHRLLTQPRRSDLTPAVALMKSLHPEPPHTPAAICSHLPTATTVLPALARHARQGDRNALLMAAVLMRHPLRRIAAYADPDSYRSTDRDARDHRDHATLDIFFTLVRTAAEPQILTARYLYNATLRQVLGSRPRPDTPAWAVRVDPHAEILDRHDTGTDHEHTAQLLQYARDHAIITKLEYETLKALFLHTGIYSLTAAADALGSNASAIERRKQRAIRKLSKHLTPAAA